MKEISGSVLSKNNILDEIEKLNNSTVDYIHLDIMDGKFVEHKCVSVTELDKILSKIKKKIDVHIMAEEATKYIEKLSLYNVSYITVHYEMKHFDKAINLIKNYGIKVGLSINPKTEVENIFPFLEYINLVLIMSVEPGKSGQVFIPETKEKINKLKNEIKRKNLNIKIEVDGGISDSVLEYLEDADILVSATYILKNLDNIEKLR